MSDSRLSRNNSTFLRQKGLAISPLALLTLTACGGGGGGVTSGVTSNIPSIIVGGSVIKGPLSNALVGLDYDGDGVVDSETVRTGPDGSYSLTTTNNTYTVIAISDDTTIDTSSGTVLSGITLKAPKGASVVTPTTTLIEESGITIDQMASVLGLPDDVDPLTFNPYADGVDADDALSVEKISHQIMSVVDSFAGAAEGSGATEFEAFETALNSVAEVVKSKASKLNETSVSAVEKTLDLTSANDLALVKDKVTLNIAEKESVNMTAFNAIVDDTVTAVKHVTDKIASVNNISSNAAKDIFSVTQVLVDQVTKAAEAEVELQGSGLIAFKDKVSVDTAALNKAPTDIALSRSEIAEDASSLLIGTLTTTDSDQPSGVLHSYAIAELAGTDYDAFRIDASTGELLFNSQPDFEAKSNYSITIISTDEGGKSLSKTFEIRVTDVILDIYLKDVSDSSVVVGIKAFDESLTSVESMGFKLDYDDSIFSLSENALSFSTDPGGFLGASGEGELSGESFFAFDYKDDAGILDGGFISLPAITGLDDKDLFTVHLIKNDPSYSGEVEFSLLDLSIGNNNEFDDVLEVLIV